MKTKRKSRRKERRRMIKINLRRKSGGYSVHVKMLIHPHNKVSLAHF
jgi:hypothetical protein